MSIDASRNGSHSIIFNAKIERTGEWYVTDDIPLSWWESVILPLPTCWCATEAGWKAKNKVSNEFDEWPTAGSSNAKSVFGCTKRWQNEHSNSARYLPLRRRHMPNHRLDVGSTDSAATNTHQRSHDFISSDFQPGHVRHSKRSTAGTKYDPLLGSQNRALALGHWLGKWWSICNALIISQTFFFPNPSTISFALDSSLVCGVCVYMPLTFIISFILRQVNVSYQNVIIWLDSNLLFMEQTLFCFALKCVSRSIDHGLHLSCALAFQVDWATFCVRHNTNVHESTKKAYKNRLFSVAHKTEDEEKTV